MIRIGRVLFLLFVMKKGWQNYDERRITGYEADGRSFYRRFRGAGVAEVIEENGLTYHLAEDGCYYPDLTFEQETDYPIESMD